MKEFEIEEVSLTFKWQFKRIIPFLPVMGTEAFALLCKKLDPFGISASKIITDSPSNKLSDFFMTIILLDGRIGVRFSVSSFEIIVKELFEDDEKNIADIAEIVFDALKVIDKDVTNGNANVILLYQLELEPQENIKMLTEHLILTKDNSMLLPEMAMYQVNLSENSSIQSATVAIAESPIHRDSIFFEINLDYSEMGELNEFVELVNNDVVSIFNTFGFNGNSLKG